MAKFPGYTILEQIDETLQSVVYRARKNEDPGTVIIKALKADNPSFSERARVRHEYELIRKTHIDGIIITQALIDTQDGLALVMEDFGGISLKELIGKEGLSIDQFLNLAIRLAETLGNLHQVNVIHRDIKPLNILFNQEKNLVKITDLGIATEIREIYNPGVIEGTLAYISPEQTGRMNCPVDYRTDLYSLGITFYEMLTGQLPFMFKDPMELVHSHIAKAPISPEQVKAQVPGQISRVVMKLLSKAPEDRYQNGFGLMADLRLCLDQLQNSGCLEPFELGLHDHSLRFIIPQILVGRDNELKILHQAFDRMSQGAVEVLLISGEPGIGKSALVNEIHKSLVKKKGYFISGKFDQFQRVVPYSAIIQALQGLARQLLTESEARIQVWKENLLLALGPNGKIITDAIPDIAHILGEQPPIPELGPEETHNRFNLAFKNFIRVFAEQEHPLVLFLDDLQWADSASFNLIQTIITDQDLRSFLLIGAYRDNEVSSHHPLMLLLDGIKKTGLTVNTITLGALSAEDVNQLLSNFLHCAPRLCLSLADAVRDKTKGNPFFIIQFLKTLYEEGSISLDSARGWTWDLQKIRELQGTDNVVQFMAEKLHNLPSASLELIQICACIGNRFGAANLSSITARPIDQILYTLDDLIKEGLINLKGDLYRFRHDRIQEAAYSLMAPDDRERNHYQIGRLGLQDTPPEQLFNRLFYLVDQLNLGRHFISTQDERNHLADLNRKAAIKAKESTAYNAAVSYLTTGLDLLDKRSWQTDYPLTYALYTEQMECQYLNRNFAEAERLFEVIIAKATTRLDKAEAYNTMVVLYTNMSRPREAIELGLKAVRSFGLNMSIDVGRGPVFLELIRVKRLLRKITLEKIVDLPRMEDQDLLAVHEVLMNIGTPAYYVNPNLFALITLKGVRASLQYGHTPHSALAFMALATIIESALGDYELGFRLGEMALKLNEKLNNPKISAKVYHIFAFFIQHWKKHVRFELDIYAKVYELAVNSGDFMYAGHSITAAAQTRFRISQRLDDVLDELKKYQEFMNIVNDPLISGQYWFTLQFLNASKGIMPTGQTNRLDEDELNANIERVRKEGNLFELCFTLYPKVLLLLVSERYEEALQTAAELDTFIHAPIGTLLVVDHYFSYSLIMAALLKQGETRRKGKFKALIRRNQRKMAKWAKLCPENFKHRYELIEAESAGIEERFREALDHYHTAIEWAHQNDYLQDEALACEQTALFYRQGGYEEEDKIFMTRAYQLYARWGSKQRTMILESKYPYLKSEGPKLRPSDSPGSITSSGNTAATLLDISTVMQTSQALSGEIVLDRLLNKIMKIAVVNAGAQRGFLILNTDGRLTIEAAEETENRTIQTGQSVPLEASDNLSTGIVQYVFRSGKNLILGNAVREGSFMNDPYIRRNRCKSILCAPIMHQGRISGILYMENSLTANAFTPERLELLGILSAQAAISLENAKLFELATTDGLTKLYVHRYFQFLLDREIHRALRHDQTFSLVMMDIDDFKVFNDIYGHLLGDEVLRSVAKGIRINSRAEDVPARYGGEEFVLILPETDTRGALVVAEKIRKSIEELEIHYDGKNLHVTISLGLATFPVHASDKDTLIKSADEAMYVAKRAGKNQCSVSEKTDALCEFSNLPPIARITYPLMTYRSF
jgi:diguanylate cyclase (GGDEF)-like protein